MDSSKLLYVIQYSLDVSLYILRGNRLDFEILSYDVGSGSEITPCNKIDKPLVVYRFMGNVTTSITTLHT